MSDHGPCVQIHESGLTTSGFVLAEVQKVFKSKTLHRVFFAMSYTNGEVILHNSGRNTSAHFFQRFIVTFSLFI